MCSNCTKNDTRTTEACGEIAELREELATATEAPDPVGEFWAWLTRGYVTVAAVGFGLPLAFALMIEMVSAFGPLGIVAYAEATRRRSSNDMTVDVAAGRASSRYSVVRRDGAAVIEQETGRVVQFIGLRTEPTASPAAISIDDLYRDYEVWCLGGGMRALSTEAFTAEFDRVRELPDLAGKIRKFGNPYYGIRLLHQKIARLLTRKRE